MVAGQLVLLQLLQNGHEVVVTHRSAFTPKYLASSKKHQGRHRNDVITCYDRFEAWIVDVDSEDIGAVVHPLLELVDDRLHLPRVGAPGGRKGDKGQLLLPNELFELWHTQKKLLIDFDPRAERPCPFGKLPFDIADGSSQPLVKRDSRSPTHLAVGKLQID